MAQALQPSPVELWHSGLGGGQLGGIDTKVAFPAQVTCWFIRCYVTTPGKTMAPMSRGHVAAGEGMPGMPGVGHSQPCPVNDP